MRFYKNVTEALFETERDLVEMGINAWPRSMQNKDVSDDKNYQTKELIGYSFLVHNANSGESMEAASKFHKVPENIVKEYCFLELMDRITLPPGNPGCSYKIREEVWKPLLNKEGRFDYTYAERVAPLIHHIVRTLSNDPASRQAVLSVWDSFDIAQSGGKERIPCSLHYQFLLRGRSIHVLYIMRSCDIYTHFGFDVTLAIMLAEEIKRRLPYPIDSVTLTMFMGSLHAYRKDYEPRGVF